MMLATGSGSIIFSHVNDAGFWLVKETFGLSLGDTFKSWSAMETLLSIFGLLAVLLLSMVVRTRGDCRKARRNLQANRAVAAGWQWPEAQPGLKPRKRGRGDHAGS